MLTLNTRETLKDASIWSEFPSSVFVPHVWEALCAAERLIKLAAKLKLDYSLGVSLHPTRLSFKTGALFSRSPSFIHCLNICLQGRTLGVDPSGEEELHLIANYINLHLNTSRVLLIRLITSLATPVSKQLAKNGLIACGRRLTPQTRGILGGNSLAFA